MELESEPSAEADTQEVGHRVDSSAFNVLSLCSGVGGLELGLKLAVPTARTVCFVEREAYCCEVLAERMEDGCLDDAPIWTDLRTFDGKPWRGVVDCVTGGYPCQPFSVAGRRRGDRDDRHVWPEVARIVREADPEWCFFENVGNHLRLGFEQVHHELQGLGYRVAAGLFTAEEVGAPHRRERLFILAHAERDRHQGVELSLSRQGAYAMRRRLTDEGGETPVVNAEGAGRGDGRAEYELRGGRRSSPCSGLPVRPPGPDDRDGWAEVLAVSPAVEPAVCGVVDGLAPRVDRLRACGNGVVPAVAALAWRTLVGGLTEAAFHPETTPAEGG